MNRISQYLDPQPPTDGLDPRAMLGLRLSTLYHRDRLGIESITTEAICVMLDEYRHHIEMRRAPR